MKRKVKDPVREIKILLKLPYKKMADIVREFLEELNAETFTLLDSDLNEIVVNNPLYSKKFIISSVDFSAFGPFHVSIPTFIEDKNKIRIINHFSVKNSPEETLIHNEYKNIKYWFYCAYMSHAFGKREDYPQIMAVRVRDVRHMLYSK
jgi:hypothetical protein